MRIWLCEFPSRLRFCLWAGGCCLGSATPCAALADLSQLGKGWVQLDTDLAVSKESLDTRWRLLVMQPRSTLVDGGSFIQANPGPWIQLDKMPVFLEMPAVNGAQHAQQIFVRPQFALGQKSDSARSFLRTLGIDAQSCIAPVLRLRSGFAGSSTRANVSISARCSIQ